MKTFQLLSKNLEEMTHQTAIEKKGIEEERVKTIENQWKKDITVQIGKV